MLRKSRKVRDQGMEGRTDQKGGKKSGQMKRHKREEGMEERLDGHRSGMQGCKDGQRKWMRGKADGRKKRDEWTAGGGWTA